MVNKKPLSSFDKIGNYFLESMDQVDKNTFHVNNLAFPVLGEAKNARKSLCPLAQERILHTKNLSQKTTQTRFRKKKNQNNWQPF